MNPGQFHRTRFLRSKLSKCRILICVVLLTTGCGKATDRISKIRSLVDAGDLEVAFSIAKQIPKENADWTEAQYLLGRIEATRYGPEKALPYFDSVPRDGSPFSSKCLAAAADIQYRACQLSAAIRNQEYLLEKSPNDVAIRTRLATAFAMSGQRSRAEPHLFEVLKQGKVKLKDLIWLSVPERQSDPDSYLAGCGAHSRDSFVQLGLATAEMRSQKPVEAKRRIIAVLKSEPGLADAQAILGELCLDEGLDDLVKWHAALPPEVLDHPEIWYICGLWARRESEYRVAARCFWETIRKSPTHQRAMYQLGQVVTPLDPIVGRAFAERAQKLKEYGDLAESVMIKHGRDQRQFQRMTSLLRDMGRDWEAWGWAVVACDMVGKEGWPLDLLNSLSNVKTENPPRMKPEHDVALAHNLSSWPGMETLPRTTKTEMPSITSPRPSAPVRFEDQSAALGVDFTYFQSHSPETRGVRMFESTGGGIGVIDFDLDGWPDLFLTQGCEWPLKADRPAPSGQYRDRLFRNQSGQFEDVTLLGCPADLGYGQGCSAGDFDNDGFPDIYVANIGANQLLRNNGDGTFSDVTQSAMIQGDSWTTSCLIADLNGDGDPDLFDVNYLQGERIFSIECSADRCSVRNYQGAPSQVQLSRGDGTFELVPDATPKINAKGLGIVLFHVDREPLPRLFIANDQVPNFFLRPTNDGRYIDEGMSSGLAVNMYGQPTACMGVAAADVNRDGKLDLFVTNFEGEANNLYLQREPGFFEDAIFGSGLMAAGIPYVGWGTQFLDVDNDGDLDLVVANGHIADFHEAGVEYRMPLQFFRSIGPARFAQVSGADIGPLFERKLFGRSLASADWNRDGRMDFVVSCMNSPTILATGQSPEAKHWLDIRLHARNSARDAIGAVVEVHVGPVITSRPLTAGDGYQASHQRVLHFGVGDAETVDRIVVRWPSGTSSEFGPVIVDATIDLIEGAPNAIEHSRDPSRW